MTRLLVVTEFGPNASGGGPAVLRQMLKGWPQADLFWWSCLPDSSGRFGQEVAQLFCARLPDKLYPQRKLPLLKSAVLAHFWTPWAAGHLRQTLRTVRPDALWLIPHNWSIPPAAAVLEPGQMPYHVTVQDYVDVHDNPRRFGRRRCSRMAAMVDRLYAGATTRDATSHPMVDDLAARTGRDAIQMLHAGLEREDFEFLNSRPHRTPDKIRIAYAGTILVEPVFEMFVSAVRAFRGDLHLPVELHLFSSHSYSDRRWFDGSWIIEHGNLRESELLVQLRQCDWGLSPMALTDDDPRYNHFSFPTKFITYLSAGLPVISIGHPESSVMKMAAQYNVGPRSQASDPAALAAALKPALLTASPMEKFGAEIIRCARTEFDADRMRRKLYGCFESRASK